MRSGLSHCDDLGATIPGGVVVERLTGLPGGAHHAGKQQRQRGPDDQRGRGHGEGPVVAPGQGDQVRRGGGARCPRAALEATVAMSARPTAPPTWREVLIRPEASPASWSGTPVVAAIVIGTNDNPSPTPTSTTGPNTWAR